MKNQQENKWASSMKPILIWMKMFGINLKVSEGKSLHNSVGYTCYVCIVILFISVSNYFWLHHKLERLHQVLAETKSPTSDDRRNALQAISFVVFSDVSDMLLYFLPYFIIFTFTLNGAWKKLRGNLVEIQKYFPFNERFQRNVRRNCFIGLALIMLVSNSIDKRYDIFA